MCAAEEKNRDYQSHTRIGDLRIITLGAGVLMAVNRMAATGSQPVVRALANFRS